MNKVISLLDIHIHHTKTPYHHFDDNHPQARDRAKGMMFRVNEGRKSNKKPTHNNLHNTLIKHTATRNQS